MNRIKLLGQSMSGIDSMINVLRDAKVLTPDEYQQIWHVIWGIVCEAKKEQDAQELAKQTAEIL